MPAIQAPTAGRAGQVAAPHTTSASSAQEIEADHLALEAQVAAAIRRLVAILQSPKPKAPKENTP